MTPPATIITGCTCRDPECKIPYGLCHCKCGGKTEISTYSSKHVGYTKGHPLPLIRGHRHWKYYRPLEDRFWEKVNKDGPVVREALGRCWVWTGCRHHTGYGTISAMSRNKPSLKAHRLSYELYHGSIDETLSVLHHCDNPPCVRPQHLFLGTNEDNMKDAASKRRVRYGRDHHFSRFTEDQVLSIREEFEKGKSQKKIADEYGVTRSTIAGITQGRSWRYAGNGSLV